MPWRYKKGEDGPIICTGPGCRNGYIPCPVDHASQPPNGDDAGVPYFRCDECDWVIPDPDGENKYATAGMICCPECGAGDRNDTYAGPCDRCRKLDRGAVYRTWPPDVAEYRRAKRYVSWNYTCPRCWGRELAEQQREAAAWRAERDRLAAEAEAAEQETARLYAEKEAYLRAHPHGTCDHCRQIKELSVIEHDLGVYLCVDCAPGGVLPDVTATIALQRTGDNAAPGWYPDPVAGAGFVRYWNGQSWQGDPVEHEEEIHA